MRLTRIVVPMLVVLNLMIFFTLGQPVNDGKATTSEETLVPSLQANSSSVSAEGTIIPNHD